MTHFNDDSKLSQIHCPTHSKVSVWDNTPSATRRGSKMVVPNLPSDVLADRPIFDDNLCKILGASSRVVTSLDLDLTFGAVNINVNLACTSLLSPLSPLPPPITSPPPSAATGEPI